MKKNIIIWFALLLLFANCEDPDKGSNFTVMEGNPIANYLDSEGTYREWCDLLKRLDLFNALNLDGTSTCFVPKQEAFRRYMDKNGYASVNDIPTDVATYLVKYHIISTRDYLTRNFPNGKLRDTTESGDYLITEYSGGSTIWVNGVAKIVQQDIACTNGHVQVISEVLEPVMETVWGKLQQEQRYSIFKEAVSLTGYDQKLDRIRQQGNSGREYSTLFVVNDSVFNAYGVEDIDGLKNLLNCNTTDYTDVSNPLNQFVGYHILNALYSFNDLANYETTNMPNGKKEKILYPIGDRQTALIEDISGQLIINRENGGGTVLDLSRMNYLLRNGVVHEINNLMMPFEPAPITFVFEFTDYEHVPPFASVSNYRTTVSGNFSTVLDPEIFKDYMRWESVPQGAAYVTYKVWYGTWNVGSGFPSGSEANFLYADQLAVNTGNIGWIEINTPVIIKGKYKLKIRTPIGPTRGTYQVFFDGEKAGSPLVAEGGYSNKTHELGDFEFRETKKHVVRLASVKSGIIELDFIMFEPIK